MFSKEHYFHGIVPRILFLPPKEFLRCLNTSHGVGNADLKAMKLCSPSILRTLYSDLDNQCVRVCVCVCVPKNQIYGSIVMLALDPFCCHIEHSFLFSTFLVIYSVLFYSLGCSYTFILILFLLKIYTFAFVFFFVCISYLATNLPHSFLYCGTFIIQLQLLCVLFDINSSSTYGVISMYIKFRALFRLLWQPQEVGTIFTPQMAHGDDGMLYLRP